MGCYSTAWDTLHAVACGVGSEGHTFRKTVFWAMGKQGKGVLGQIHTTPFLNNREMLTANAPRRRKRGRDDAAADGDGDGDGEMTLGAISTTGRNALPLHLLFECATGYALFHARGIYQVGMDTFQSVENYLNQSEQPFKLESYLPFSSDEDALTQMKAISSSLLTPQLLNFIKDSIPQPKTAGSRHSLSTLDPHLTQMITSKTRLGSQHGVLIRDVMRGLRMKIHEFIGMTRGELENAQLNLARLYINQMRTKTHIKSRILVSSSSSLHQQVVRVVPHRFNGVFNIEGNNNMLCTINLVPGEALYGEELVRVQNVEDTTISQNVEDTAISQNVEDTAISQNVEDTAEVEVEYRVWNSLRSKLGAAILSGVTNIWIKPGSRVLYIGNVCGLTVFDLSDLVGSDGLVYYVVGLSDDVVDMAGKRPNVVTIIEKRSMRMLVGLVDVIFAEIDRRLDQLHALEALFIIKNAHLYLRAGGHYVISARANDIDSGGQVKDLFAQNNYKKEFRLIETIMLDLMEGAYELGVVGYRMLEE